MDYISKLTDDELRVICNLIPLKHFRDYFKKTPKRFNKLSKYRPEKVPLSEIKRIVVNRGSDPFISDFLNSSIQALLIIVHEQISLFTDAGDDTHTALLRALPKSDFCEHIDLYFKLSEDEYSPEYAALVQSAIVEIEAKGKIVDAAEAETVRDEVSSAELEHLRSALAEAQQNLAQERESHASLQAQYSTAQEQIEESERKLAELQKLASYADPSADISADKNLPYTSLCCVGMPTGNSLELCRIADIVDGLFQVQRQDGSPQRDVLYTKDRSKQKNYIGIWAWRTEPNYNPGRLDYIVSEFLPAHIPVQIIVVPGCRTVEDLKACLCQGIVYAPDGERTLYAVAADGEYTGLLCGKSDITEKNGIVTLKSSVTKLPLYKFHEQEIIKVREWSFFYRIHLGIPMELLQIRDPLETVKELVLQHSSISRLKDWGTIREARGFRTFLQGLPVTDFLQEIAELCNCSLEEAKNYVNEFVQHAEEYLQGMDAESTILCTALEYSSVLTEKCRALNEEKWRREHAERLKQAQEELAKVTDETQRQIEQHDRLIMEQQRLKERQDTLTAEIAQQEQLAADVENQVTARIKMARERAADFICEMAFHSPAAVTLPTPVSQDRFMPGKKLDTDIREHHEAWDAVCTLQDELEEAGVTEEYASMLAAFLYTAYVLHTPLLLAGPNGHDIADAISVALFGRTVSTFRCEGAYDPSAVEEYTGEESQVITLLDPINTRWISHISELTAGKDKLILAVHPFAEDLLIEPRGPIQLCSAGIDRAVCGWPASGEYVGGYFGTDFREYECAEPQKKVHLARKLPMPAMLRNRLQQMLADMKAILGKDTPDYDVLFAALPYAYVTGRTDMILEGIEDGGGLSKNTQTLLRTFLGELQ